MTNNKNKKEQANKICAFWQLYDEDDISTPRLLEMCRQHFKLKDVGDVIEGLKLGGLLQEVTEKE